MQALILAAGMGRRLEPLTLDRTKSMVHVHGRTLLERSLDAIVSVGVDRIVLVVGFCAEGVKELIGDDYAGVPVVYVVNEDYDKTNNIYSLFIAREEFQADDTLLLESDLIYDPEILERLVAAPEPDIAVVSRLQSWMDGTMVTLSDEGDIERFVPKAHIKSNRLDTYYKTVNIYKFSMDFIAQTYLPFLEAYVRAVGRNEYYELVLRVIAGLDKQGLVAMRLNDERWYEIDDLQDLQIAETLFAPPEERYDAYLQRHGGYWRFPELRDYCYLVNPYFPSAKMDAELRRSFSTLLREYPSSFGVQNHLAAKMFGCDPDDIMVGNGAAELITLLGQELAVQTVGVSVPTFEEYLKRFPNAELVVHQAHESGYSADVEVFRRLFTSSDAVVLVNPDNPSGQALSTDEVLRLANEAELREKRLIVDESFVDFADPGHCTSILTRDILAAHPHLIVVKSISKSYGVPGARLGVLATGDKDLLDRLRSRTSVWNINSFGEYFLQIMGKYQGDYQDACDQIRQERERFVARLESVPGLHAFPSHANYVLCRLDDGVAPRDLATRLLTEHSILIKDCSNKPGFASPSFVRLAVRDRRDNDFFIEAMQQVMKELVG